jgi:hypothetical protein
VDRRTALACLSFICWAINMTVTWRPRRPGQRRAPLFAQAAAVISYVLLGSARSCSRR